MVRNTRERRTGVIEGIKEQLRTPEVLVSEASQLIAESEAAARKAGDARSLARFARKLFKAGLDADRIFKEVHTMVHAGEGLTTEQSEDERDRETNTAYNLIDIVVWQYTAGRDDEARATMERLTTLLNGNEYIDADQSKVMLSEAYMAIADKSKDHPERQQYFLDQAGIFAMNIQDVKTKQHRRTMLEQQLDTQLDPQAQIHRMVAETTVSVLDDDGIDTLAYRMLLLIRRGGDSTQCMELFRELATSSELETASAELTKAIAETVYRFPETTREGRALLQQINKGVEGDFSLAVEIPAALGEVAALHGDMDAVAEAQKVIQQLVTAKELDRGTDPESEEGRQRIEESIVAETRSINRALITHYIERENSDDLPDNRFALAAHIARLNLPPQFAVSELLRIAQAYAERGGDPTAIPANIRKEEGDLIDVAAYIQGAEIDATRVEGTFPDVSQYDVAMHQAQLGAAMAARIATLSRTTEGRKKLQEQNERTAPHTYFAHADRAMEQEPDEMNYGAEHIWAMKMDAAASLIQAARESLPEEESRNGRITRAIRQMGMDPKTMALVEELRIQNLAAAA